MQGLGSVPLLGATLLGGQAVLLSLLVDEFLLVTGIVIIIINSILIVQLREKQLQLVRLAQH